MHERTLGEPGLHDIYLAPHSDDACFSLGHLAKSRGRGTLLTVFAQSTYVAGGGASDAKATARVTRLRMIEDARFAQACGLEPQWLRFADAQARGDDPFATAGAPQAMQKVRDAVLRFLSSSTLGLALERKPWLFCPAGIGGHVDHVALAWLVSRRWRALSARFRIAFYEDLHYASNAKRRDAGVARLHAMLPKASWSRIEVPMSARDAQEKLRLVRLYGSQLEPKLDRIDAFTPATGPDAAPHEALWLPMPELHHREG